MVLMLCRGIGAATLRLIPSAIVSFGAYELMRRFITDLENKQEEALARAQQQQLHGVLHRAKQCNQLLQQVVEQGPAAAVAALTDMQQCQVCRPEAVLEAAVQGLQQQEWGSTDSSSRRAIRGTVCCNDSSASNGSSQCGIPLACSSSTVTAACDNLGDGLQQQSDAAHDACSTAADCSSNGCITVTPLVLDAQHSSSSSSSSRNEGCT
jgi:hypothetical protein